MGLRGWIEGARGSRGSRGHPGDPMEHTGRTNQPKVVQEVLADLKMPLTLTIYKSS